MDAHTNSHSVQDDTSQNTLAKNETVDHEYESGNIPLNEDSVLGKFSTGNVHLDLVTESGDSETHERQSSIRPLKSDQEHDCTNPQIDSDQAVLAAISEGVPPAELPMVPAGASTSAMDINDSEVPESVYPQEPPLSCPGTDSSAVPCDAREGEADLDNLFNCTPMLHMEPDLVRGVSFTDEDGTREDGDYLCEELPSSLPPSSSPPQLFSSSPHASSQSSVDGVEPSKMVLDVEIEGSASAHDCSHADYVAAQDEPRLESKCFHGCDIVDVATSSETNNHYPKMDATSRVESNPWPSKKRTAFQSDADEYDGSQSNKRPKPDSHLYLPPTPMRATHASQNRQFKKLAAPFRPPTKLPVVRDKAAQTMNNRAIDSAGSSRPETVHDKPDLKEPTTHVSPLQHKASNTSRPAAQFKSPLVNTSALPADCRTIRLTPALQGLERKLQLLKRAIKVKEDSEEEVLASLAEKWLEAGREVAYDVWDAVKDLSNFEGKMPAVHKACWENSNSGNIPWGWDTKLGDAGEESCNPDSSVAVCITGLEEDDDDGSNNTLGTMLHRLGIAPEIFGWDNNKETFSD